MRNKVCFINFVILSFIILFIFSCAGINKNVSNESIPPNVKILMNNAIDKVKPALVRIHVVSTSYEDGREIKRESAGSGVIINSLGYVITNHHVAGKTTYISCTLTNKEEIEAELIGTDPLADIAIIKLKNEKNHTFPKAEFGDSEKVKVGDYVLAMGSPLALSQSVT
ncbi:trypsin-like peptidase domain-containing protein, partial [Candidatus Desantisbacteria bacterium]|nr:trypsin-like peptidase domain-containing protein [Candidatus Desantisbacteria bacterium]